ncbi:MAG: endo alpha-1,4 polygalactosaminidase [Fervidobacterium sp.]|uniref:endo alpha-1,4 polygalactosaminidase n=1 Tax=Fervidobacterium TaxID=2422 RepID=UPI0030A2A695
MDSSFAFKLSILITLVISVLLITINLYAVEIKQGWILFTNGPDINSIINYPAKIVVIDYSADGTDKKAFSSAEINLLKSTGKKVFSYINFAIAEDWRFYWNKLPKSIILGNLEGWTGEYYVKYWYAEWYSIIKEYMTKISNANFDGVVLDWINVYTHENLQKLSGKTQENLKLAIVENIRKIVSEFPKMEYVLINGEDILIEFPDLKKSIKYVLVESLFFTNTKLKLSTKYYTERLGKLLKLRNDGIEILSVEYIDNGNPLDKTNSERIKTYVELATKYGFIYYIARTDMKLDILNVPRVMN